MLGLARASQLSGWGGDLPVRVFMASTGTMNYAVYQRFAYSWNTDIDDQPTWKSTMDPVAAGQYSVSDIPSLPNYKELAFTSVITVQLQYPAGLSDNQGYKIFHQFRGGTGGFIGNYAWVHDYDGATGLVFNSMGGQGAVLPGNNYLDYNGRWLTCVTSISDTDADFVDWDPSPFFGTPNFYIRLCVYDTETGELLAKQDSVNDFEPRPFGVPTDLAQWIADGSADPDGINSEGFGTEYAYAQDGGGNFESMPPGITARIAGIWTSWGTMFDPVSATDRSWLTIRPNAVIESAVAWQNAQFTDFNFRAQGGNNYEAAYSTAEGRDRWSQVNNRQLALIPFGGNEARFNQYLDTTPIKSRG